MITSRHIRPNSFWGLTKQVGPWKTTTTDLAHEAHGYDSPHNQVQEVRPFQQDGSSPRLTWTTPKIVDPGNLAGFRNAGISRFDDKPPLGRNVQIFNQQFFNGPRSEAAVQEGVRTGTKTPPTTTVSEQSEIKREAEMDAERAGQIGAPLVPSRDLKPDFTLAQRTALGRLKEQLTGESIKLDTSNLDIRIDPFLVSDRGEVDETSGFNIRGTREDLTKIPKPVVAPPPVKQEVPDRVVEVFVPVKEELMAVDPLTVQDVVPEKGLFQFIEPETGLVFRRHSLTVEDISQPFLAPSPRHFGKSRKALTTGKLGANKSLMSRIRANVSLQPIFRVPKLPPPTQRRIAAAPTTQRIAAAPTKRDVAIAIKKGELVPGEARSSLRKDAPEVFVSRKRFIVSKKK